jgi:hypothetical protein
MSHLNNQNIERREEIEANSNFKHSHQEALPLMSPW